jgi:hypothetical protein
MPCSPEWSSSAAHSAQVLPQHLYGTTLVAPCSTIAVPLQYHCSTIAVPLSSSLYTCGSALPRLEMTDGIYHMILSAFDML